MRILLAMHYAPPHIGGMETVVKKQIQSLSKLGNKVHLVTCRHDTSLPLHETLSTHSIQRFRALNFIENKFGVTYPLISPLHFFSLLRSAGKNDIVHVHDVFYELSHLSGIAALLRKKPLYITQHVALVEHPSKLVMFVQKAIYNTIGKFLFQKAAGIVVYNSNVKDYLLSLGIDEKKIVQTHNGVDTTFFSPNSTGDTVALKKKYGLPTDRPVILFVGRLVHKKGFDLVAQANSTDYTILIVGTGTVPAKLKKLKNVVFYGPANEAQLLDMYRLSDSFVFPATGEIFTLVMQEAMACGTPVITAADPGYENYDLDRKLIAFTARDTPSIKKHIKKVIANKSLRSAMSQYSRQLALQKFSWAKNYTTEYAIYREHSGKAL